MVEIFLLAGGYVVIGAAFAGIVSALDARAGSAKDRYDRAGKGFLTLALGWPIWLLAIFVGWVLLGRESNG